eukprot:3066023-Ditylum_brightwellii.AAC.1
MLMKGETVVADHGYCGDLSIKYPDMGSDDQNKAMSCVHAHHETANGQLKNWVVLSQRFRHGREKHHTVEPIIDPILTWE